MTANPYISGLTNQTLYDRISQIKSLPHGKNVQNKIDAMKAANKLQDAVSRYQQFDAVPPFDINEINKAVSRKIQEAGDVIQQVKEQREEAIKHHTYKLAQTNTFLEQVLEQEIDLDYAFSRVFEDYLNTPKKQRADFTHEHKQLDQIVTFTPYLADQSKRLLRKKEHEGAPHYHATEFAQASKSILNLDYATITLGAGFLGVGLAVDTPPEHEYLSEGIQLLGVGMLTAGLGMHGALQVLENKTDVAGVNQALAQTHELANTYKHILD